MNNRIVKGKFLGCLLGASIGDAVGQAIGTTIYDFEGSPLHLHIFHIPEEKPYYDEEEYMAVHGSSDH